MENLYCEYCGKHGNPFVSDGKKYCSSDCVFKDEQKGLGISEDKIYNAFVCGACLILGVLLVLIAKIMEYYK